jgi:hypothetical protein
VSIALGWFITAISGDEHESAQEPYYFRRGTIRRGSCNHRIAGVRADVPELSLRRRLAVHRRIFEYDRRAHMQIDGRAVTLGKRLALSGSRYSGGGVTLKITRAGTTVKHAKRPTTACEPT